MHYKQLWRAPELLRAEQLRGTQKGDIYAFGIILFEIYGRSGPYGEEETTISEIVRRVTNPGPELMRPNIDLLRDVATEMDTELPEYVVTLMQECWAEDPELRYQQPISVLSSMLKIA